jgi:hypothetical protein
MLSNLEIFFMFLAILPPRTPRAPRCNWPAFRLSGEGRNVTVAGAYDYNTQKNIKQQKQKNDKQRTTGARGAGAWRGCRPPPKRGGACRPPPERRRVRVRTIRISSFAIRHIQWWAGGNHAGSLFLLGVLPPRKV